ncbi:hypothetical protein P5673_000588 [Acropora cervicornis]|uniref:Uncharacterized protein n=1 Tax=Acropora cervicornis TaxID=6130 RepID=A0AAD9R799_ACRCE|nr:hypothetical protein P5673_000588 [Acropora cervicornis]
MLYCIRWPRLAVNSSNQVAVRRSRELNFLNLFTFGVCVFCTSDESLYQME